jgi:hypothetical protein
MHCSIDSFHGFRGVLRLQVGLEDVEVIIEPLRFSSWTVSLGIIHYETVRPLAGLLAIKLLRIDRSNHELRRCNFGCTDGEGCRPGAFWNHQIFPMH